MDAGPLHERDVAGGPPDEQPVSGVTHVTFGAAGPVAGQHVHVVPAPQGLDGFGRVLDDEVDKLLERLGVDVLFASFLTSLEKLGENWAFSLPIPYASSAAATRSAPLSKDSPVPPAAMMASASRMLSRLSSLGSR